MRRSESIDEFLTRARVAIDNGLGSTQIQAALSLYGYTAEKIQEGKVMCDTAVATVQQRQAEYGDQIAATETLNQTLATAKTTYIPFVQVARIAFKKDPGMATQLALNGKRKQSLSGWLEQAKVFYSNTLGSPAAVAKLAEFGITEEKLQSGQAEVVAVEAANSAQETEKGEAQQATKVRDEAIDVLDDWLDDYLGIAEVALAESPQLLEGLGIVVPS